MGGEDSDSDKNIAEGYWYPEQGNLSAPDTTQGKVITALLTLGATAFKVVEVSAIGPLAFLIDAVIGSAFQEKVKSKRSATARKMFGNE